MRYRTRQLVAWAGLAVAMGAAGASAQDARTLDAGGGLYLHQFGSRAVLREPTGAASEVVLPRGATLWRLVRLSDGWLATGAVDVGGVRDLLLLADEGGVRRPFPAPPNRTGELLRGGAQPLVSDGRLVGLAWLAGAGVRQTAVWAARWTGVDWSPPELVSPVGPGTQIALDGAVLADGSWLLVWSAHDGGDDEILWSRRVGESWSEPAPLHEPNEAPDITPSLVAAGGGALAAWNWWDGRTYRVRLAHFEGGHWRELDFDGPAGAIGPSLTPFAGGARLLFNTVAPPAWVLHELDAGGAKLRTASVASRTTLRPALAPDGPRVGLEWPGERLAAPLRAEPEWRVEP